MLDFGFSEILLTSAIALVVLGPERLPKVARQVGNWMGRARAMARQLSEQLEREVSADELFKEQTRTKVLLPNRMASSTLSADPYAALPDPHAPLPGAPPVGSVDDATAAHAYAASPMAPDEALPPHQGAPLDGHLAAATHADAAQSVTSSRAPADPTPHHD